MARPYLSDVAIVLRTRGTSVFLVTGKGIDNNAKVEIEYTGSVACLWKGTATCLGDTTIENHIEIAVTLDSTTAPGGAFATAFGGDLIEVTITVTNHLTSTHTTTLRAKATVI